MKKFGFAFVSLLLINLSHSQTLFTYGKKAVTRDEFVTAFNKNPNITPNRKQALKEYLNLYVNFKLKVQAAYDAGLNKDATQQYELQNFKRQVADNIINEQANVKALVNEAFERSQKEISLAQIFVELPPNGDTVEAFKRIQAAYKELKDGKDFGSVSQQFSTDEATKQLKGELGYITAFSLPYSLENIAYGLKPNSISAPFKTKIGFHIFKNLGERTPLGSRRVAQILISFLPNGTVEDKNIARRKADSIYNLLQQAASFEELAATVSNDLSSSNNHGELPEFTSGTYHAEFEAVAFSLKNKGDIAGPVQTTYGFHILKLLEAKPAPTNLNDATTFANLQEKVTKDSRMQAAKRQFIQKKLAQLKYKPGVYKEQDLFAFTDSATTKQKVSSVKGINDNTLLFSFAKQNVKASDWVNYIRAARSNPSQVNRNNYPELFKDYFSFAAHEYYRNNLQEYNKEFSKQAKEFQEANLLFSVMEKNVWEKANSDTAVLLQYYNQHKSKYTWPQSADAIIVTCNNLRLAEEIQEKIRTTPGSWRLITGSNGSDVVADSSRYELGQLPVVDRTNFTKGLLTAPVKNETEGTYTFNYIIEVYPDGQQRSFEDARGLVITDHQQVLEESWIKELKKKYPVRVNQVVFDSIK